METVRRAVRDEMYSEGHLRLRKMCNANKVEGERYKEKCRKTAAQAKIFKLLSVKSDASAPRVRLNSQKYAQLQK